MEETTRTTADDLDEDGAERPRLPRAVMDWSCQPGPETTTLEAVGHHWRHTLIVVQAGDDDDDDDDGDRRFIYVTLERRFWCKICDEVLSIAVHTLCD